MSKPNTPALRRNRNRRTGRFAATNFDLVCACCGATLGAHDAEWPNASEAGCPGFRRAR